MDKLIYILWGPALQPRKQTQQVLLQEAAPALLAAGARKLTMYIADQDADFKSAAPFHPGERMCADVSLWLDSLEAACTLRGHHQRPRGSGWRASWWTKSYTRSTAATATPAPGTGPTAERSPGLVAVTLMERPKRLSREEWIKRWHGRQSPVSEAMQPRCRYVRNVVVKAVTPEAPPYEGIVEEAWPSVRHATNPFLFYGAGRNPLKLAWNMAVMLRSVTAFLDLNRIRTTYTSEYTGPRTPASTF